MSCLIFLILLSFLSNFPLWTDQLMLFNFFLRVMWFDKTILASVFLRQSWSLTPPTTTIFRNIYCCGIWYIVLSLVAFFFSDILAFNIHNKIIDRTKLVSRKNNSVSFGWIERNKEFQDRNSAKRCFFCLNTISHKFTIKLSKFKVKKYQCLLRRLTRGRPNQ